MEKMTHLVGFAMCCMAAGCSAQAPSLASAVPAVAQAPAPWPDTPSTRIFRQRTLDLALIYGDSGGLDENGYLIQTTDLGLTAPGSTCHRVRARTSLGGVPVADEVIETCK